MSTEWEKAFLEWLGSIPESEENVVVEFFNALRQATSLADVNVAAGIAYTRLTGRAA